VIILDKALFYISLLATVDARGVTQVHVAGRSAAAVKLKVNSQGHYSWSKTVNAI